MSYKSLIRTPYNQLARDDFHTNRVSYNISTSYKAKSKNCII